MVVQDTLTEIKKAVKDNIPGTALITKVDFEGPGVVLYSKNPTALAGEGNIIKDLARIIRKRVIVRPDPSVLSDPDEAAKKIKKVVPEDAGITDITFDTNFGEAVIEAVKPGLVIGKAGKTLGEIKKTVGWTPRVTRTPPIKSKIVESVRRITTQKSDERKELLRKVGRRIHRMPMVRGGYWIRTSVLGGFREVGRTSIYLHTPESKVLIDCGVNVAAQDKDKMFPYLNVPEFKLQELDAVVITHAHLDHCGFLPYLFYMGYEGPVYCTPPTRDLMFLLQWDYLDVAEREGKELPYPRKMVKKVVNHVIPLEYGEVTDISPDIRLTLHNAGHILGSSIAHFHIGDGLYNLAYTGDLKFERSRLFEPANIRFPRLETLITESTYGSAKDIQPPRKKAEAHLARVVSETITRKGKAIVPVFAVGRAQELMVSLVDHMKRGNIPEVPIYLDGMIWEATGIHTTYPEYLNRELRDKIFHKGDNPFIDDAFKQVSSPAMRQEIIDSDEPAIVLATSGMLAGGPIMEYFRQLAEDEKNAIIFVGYQSEGSMGRRVQKGWRELPIADNGRTRMIPINMQVHTIDGFSGHSDRNQLINYIRRLNAKPERILTCHGEESKCIELASVLYKTFKSETRAPYNLETIRAL